MIKEQDLLDAIAECQGERNPNANTCRNLASFYTILDHLRKTTDPVIENYSYSSDPNVVTYDGDTEFALAIQGKGVDDVLSLMDELMTTLQVINPRLYDGVMRKTSTLN